MSETPPPTPPQQPYYAPQPMLESEARTMSMLGHLLALIFGFVAPLVVWLIYRDRSALVAHHGKEQLNFQISLLIYSFGAFAIATIFSIVTFGIGSLIFFPLVLGIVALDITVIVLGATSANRGEYRNLPMTIRFIS